MSTNLVEQVFIEHEVQVVPLGKQRLKEVRSQVHDLLQISDGEKGTSKIVPEGLNSVNFVEFQKKDGTVVAKELLG